MDSSPQAEDAEDSKTRTKRIYVKRVRDSTNVRRSSRVQVQRMGQDPKSDSERLDGRKRGIRWSTLEKQLLLRSLKEKSAVSQFNTLAIKRIVKTKKKSDVDMFIKNLRRRAVKAKIESMRIKSPIEIWQDLMNHFGDRDGESLRVMSKVMVMASLERTKNAEEVTCDDFKPFRIYRYLAALFKSKELPVLTPLESQVILDCFENMLEVLKGSEVRDKAAFLRSQYFTLYNRAYAGGNEYSLEDNLSLVFKEAEAEKEAEPNQSRSSTASLQPRTDVKTNGENPGTNRTGPGTIESAPGTDPTSGVTNPGTSRTGPGTIESAPGTDPASGVTNPGTSGTEPGTTESIHGPHQTSGSANLGTSRTEPGTSESVPGTSGTVPKTSGAVPNGPRKRASWQGGVDRSTEVRILNPLGIPVEMLEFKPRDDKNHRKKRWTYEYETDSSDSDDTYGNDGNDSGDIDRRMSQVKRKRGRPRTRDRAVASEDDAQDCTGSSPGEANGLQEMAELLNTDQYALVTEEEFARNGKIYLQAMAEAQSESDGNLDFNEVVASEQYIFVAKDDVAREGENFVQGLEETEGGKDDESHETRELDDTGHSKPTGKDFLGSDGESSRAEQSSALFGSEIDDQAENDQSSENEGTESEIDQSEVIDDSIDQSEFMGENIGQSDADISANHPDELGAEMSVVDDEDGGTHPSENILPTSSPAISHKCPPLEPPESDDLINLVHVPLLPAGSVAEQPSSRTVVPYIPQPDCSWFERPSEAISPQSLPMITSRPTTAVDAICQSELRSRCEDIRETLTAVSLPSNQTTVSNPVQTNVTQVLPDQHLHVASESLRMDDADIPSTNTPKVHPDRPESQGNVKSRPVRFLLPEKKSQPNESSVEETLGDPTPNTIPLVSALNRGMVRSDQSDDQLLTIDVSQLGPDSNIVIPSYLLPGGILTIRSPEVSHMRSGLSSLIQTGTSSAITNDHLDLSKQSQAGISPARQSQDGISAHIEPGSDVESSSEYDISQTEYVVASDQLSKESHDLCEVHVIANRIVKPSNQAEVPLKTAPKALPFAKKPEASNQKLQISKKSEASDILDGIQSEVVQPEIEERSFLEFLSSQKSAWNQRERSTTPSGLSQKENDVANSELEGLNMDVQAVHNVNIPISKSWQDKMINCQFAASKSLTGVGKTNGCQPQNISKHTTSAELESMKQKDESFPNTRSQPRDQMSLSQVGLDILSHLHSGEKHKRGRPPKYKPPITERSPLASEIQQDGIAGLSSEGKRKSGRPRKTDQSVDLDLVMESDEILGHPAGGLDEQGVIVTPAGSNHATERVVGEKRKCGRPPKYAGINSGINLQEERKTESHVEMEISAVTHSLSMSRSRSQGRMGSVSNPQEDITRDVQKTSTYIKELMNDSGDAIRGKLHNEKQERGRPPKVQNVDASRQSHDPQISAMALHEKSTAKERKDKGVPNTASFDLQRKVPTRQPKGSGWIASHSDTDSSAGSPQKRKKERPPKGSKSNSLDNLQSSIGFSQLTEMETDIKELGADSETNSGTEKRKRGRPRKGSRPNSVDNLQSSNGLSQSTEMQTDIRQLGSDSETDSGTEKRKRGRPRKGSRPNSTDNLQSSNGLNLSTEREADIGQLGTDSEPDSATEKRKRGRPHKGSRSNSVHKSSNGLNLSTEREADIGQLGTDSETDSGTKKRKRGRSRKGSRPNSVDNLQSSNGLSLSTEREADIGQLGTDSEPDSGTEKRKRGRPRKGSRSNSVDNLQSSNGLSLSTQREANIGQLGTDFETDSGTEKRKRGRPHKGSRSNSFHKSSNGLSLSTEREADIGQLGTDSETDSGTEKIKRGRSCKRSRPNSVDNLQSSNYLSQSTKIQADIRQLGADSTTDSGTEKGKRGRPSKGSRRNSVDNLPSSNGLSLSIEREANIGQLGTDSETDSGTEKRKRGRPRKESRPDSHDDLLDKAIACQAGTGLFETYVGSEREKEGKTASPRKVFSPYKRNNGNTAKAGSERVAEIRGGPPKDVIKDQTETHILETDERMHGEEKRKRGRPPKGPRTESLVCLGNTMMTNQSPESHINIGELGAVSQTEIEVKRKRGRPRKESRSDSCYVFSDSDISGQVTENVKGIAQCESDSRKGREERERPSSEFITNHPNQSTDVRTSSDQLEAVAEMEKGNRGRPPIRRKPRKELASTPSNSLPHPVAMSQSVMSDYFDSVGQSETVLRTETGDDEKKGGCHREIRPAPPKILHDRVDINQSRAENKKKGRRSKEKRPAPITREIRPPPTNILLNRVTTNPSIEHKRSISPLRSGADSSIDRQRKGNSCENIRTDQIPASTSDTASKLEEGTKKRGRGRPRREFQVNSSNDPQSTELQGQPRGHHTSSSHLEQQEKQKIGNPQKGSGNEMLSKETKTHSEENETSVSPSENQTGREEKRKRGRPRKTGKPDADLGSESPQEHKRGRPSKTVDMGSSKIDVESSVTKSRSPNKEAIKNQAQTASRTEGSDQQERAPYNVLPHGLDIQQSTNSETNITNSVSDSGREVEENEPRPHWRRGLASATEQTSVKKTLPTRELSIDQTPSEVAKHVSFSNDPPSVESGTQPSPGKITRSILKKRRKRSPLKVNVGRALADKRQKSLDSTRQLEASSVGGKSTPFAKPFTSMFHESDLVFGKPKKRVSFEDAIDMMNTLDEGEVLGKNLFMTDVVSQTAMKEVIKIVEQVGVERESIVAPQPQKKTSVFFSIKKS